MLYARVSLHRMSTVSDLRPPLFFNPELAYTYLYAATVGGAEGPKATSALAERRQGVLCAYPTNSCIYLAATESRSNEPLRHNGLLFYINTKLVLCSIAQ